MRRMIIETDGLGFTEEELQIAGRVCLAVYRKAEQVCAERGIRRKSDLCHKAIGDTLLRVAGWKTQREVFRAFVAWLQSTKKTTVVDAHNERMRLTMVCGNGQQHKLSRQRTCQILMDLRDEGRIRYVSADRGSPGLVIWKE